jgi:hypothetical protein
MSSMGEIGLKITLAQREFYRYTGASAALEKRGAGASRPDLAWVRRQAEEKQSRSALGKTHDETVCVASQSSRLRALFSPTLAAKAKARRGWGTR